MDPVHALRLFGLNNLGIEADIQRVEVEQKVDLGHQPKSKGAQEKQFYPQFSAKLREES
jgi:hypothetical protein